MNVSLAGGATTPEDGFQRILLNSVAVAIAESHAVLCFVAAAVCRFLKPLKRLFQVFLVALYA